MCENKVLSIGIDEGSWDLLNPLMSMGAMPNLERLKSKGAPGDLQSVIPPFSLLRRRWTMRLYSPIRI